MDNFRFTPPLADSKSTNHGDYVGGPTLGNTGAIAGDANTAALFDGIDDFGTVARQIGDDFSIEFWFKSSQSAGANCNQWWDGMRLVDADVSIVSPLTYYNNAWHHVVFTRTKSPAAMQLFVDGALVIAGTPNNTGSLTASSTIAFGRAAGGGSFYSGLLDEIAVYNTVLSGATATAHYAAAQ